MSKYKNVLLMLVSPMLVCILVIVPAPYSGDFDTAHTFRLDKEATAFSITTGKREYKSARPMTVLPQVRYWVVADGFSGALYIVCDSNTSGTAIKNSGACGPYNGTKFVLQPQSQ